MDARPLHNRIFVQRPDEGEPHVDGIIIPDSAREKVPPPDRPSTDEERTDLRKRLRDLISALDRRVPHFDRDGEHRIVRDAKVLKQQAQDRLAELE